MENEESNLLRIARLETAPKAAHEALVESIADCRTDYDKVLDDQDADDLLESLAIALSDLGLQSVQCPICGTSALEHPDSEKNSLASV